jgi:hypothetical protein
MSKSGHCKLIGAHCESSSEIKFSGKGNGQTFGRRARLMMAAAVLLPPIGCPPQAQTQAQIVSCHCIHRSMAIYGNTID